MTINDAPIIGTLLDGPDPAIEGANLTLELDSLSDDSASMKVDFYRDADEDSHLDKAVDQHLGSDNDGADGWSITVSTEGFGTGGQRYFAVATDAEGLSSNVATATGSVGLVGVLDNAHPGYSETGSGWVDGTSANSVDGAYRSHPAGTGLNTADWVFTGLPNALHRVSVTWAADVNNATNAPFKVYDGANLIGTFLVDQTAAPASLFDGQWWHDLGTFPIENGAIRVELSDAADGTVIADAVRAQDPPSISYLAADRDKVIHGTAVLLTAHGVVPGDANGSVAQVEFSVDGNVIGIGVADGDNWNLSYDSSLLSLPTYPSTVTFSAIATDGNGNASGQVDFDVDILADVTSGLVGH